LNNHLWFPAFLVTLLLVSAAFGAIQAVNAQDIPILGYPYDTNQAGGGETEGGYRLSGTLFTLNGDATIMSMSCEMSINNDNNNPAPAHYRFAIYQDNAGTVGALLAQTEVGIKNPPAGGSWFSDQWRTVNFASPVSLQAGSYWLVVISEDKYVMIHDSYSINQSRSVHALVNSLNPPTSFNSSAYIDVPLVIAIYASGYGASSVLPPPPPTNDPVASRAFLSAKSSDSSNGKIEIVGNLTANNTGVPLANMTFSYRSISESESMLHQFAKTTTDSSGNILWNRNYDGLSDDNLQFTRAYDLLEPAPNQFVMTGTQQSYGQMLTGLDGFMTRVSLRNGDTTPPKITVLSPENKIYTTSNLPLICTVDKSTLWMAYQIDNGRNVTMSGNTTLTLPDGQHNMTIYAADANYNNGASNIVFFSNFEVDTVPINVAVTSIQNTTYDSKDLPLSFTVGKAVSWTAYSLDGQANFTSPQNTTLTGLSYGTHTLTVYAQDSIGLIEASDTIKFAILDQSLPEFPNILVVAFALSIISITTLVLLKIKSKQSYLTTKNELG
jgi:hypothetical protein